MSKETYYIKMTPFAALAAARAQMPIQVILAQWAHESEYGESSLAKRANNHAGIKYTENADFKSGMYSGYNNLFNFANDYARVMHLSYYDKIRAAKGQQETVNAFIGSPYAEDKSYANKLGKTIDNTPLLQYIPIAIAGVLLLLISSK